MKRQQASEDGFVLVYVLMLMVVLMILGVSGIGTSIFETKMASNNALHKQTFYEADGGTEVGIRLVAENMKCIGGFSSASMTSGIGDGINVVSGRHEFWITNNLLVDPGLPDPFLTDTTSTKHRDFWYNTEHGTNHLRINSKTKLTTGAAIQMSAGYEGRGRGVGTDGAYLKFDINSLHQGTRNNQSGICIGYRVDSQFSNSPYGNCVY
jgi:hypothetical protein